MKKLFTLILLCVFTCLVSNAQFIGLRGGFSSSTITASNQNDCKSIHGFQCGIFAEFPLSTTAKWLTIETGLMIQPKGSDITSYGYYHALGQMPWSTRFQSISNVLTNLYYLDIPLSVKMYSSVGKTSLYFEVGPYLGIGLSGKQDGRKISWGPSNIDDYKRFDGGISMGVGLKTKPFLIGLSYDLGLTNIYPSGDTDYYSHNKVFSVFMEFIIIHKDKSTEQMN